MPPDFSSPHHADQMRHSDEYLARDKKSPQAPPMTDVLLKIRDTLGVALSRARTIHYQVTREESPSVSHTEESASGSNLCNMLVDVLDLSNALACVTHEAAEAIVGQLGKVSASSR